MARVSSMTVDALAELRALALDAAQAAEPHERAELLHLLRRDPDALTITTDGGVLRLEVNGLRLVSAERTWLASAHNVGTEQWLTPGSS